MKISRELVSRSHLQNEKYKGDALLQKTDTVDFLTKKRIANDGQVNQYYVEDSHEGIIDEETWEAVQLEIARRKTYREEHQLKSYIMQSKTPVSPRCSAEPAGQPLDGRIGQLAEGNVKFGNVTTAIASREWKGVTVAIWMRRHLSRFS